MIKIKNVCVFASSCNFLDKLYYENAKKLGELLSDSGMNMVYGGSSLGLMWSCAESVKNGGMKLIGVMPEKLHNYGVSTDVCDEFHLTKCMRTRKAKMDEVSDAIVAIAGGFGTLEELAEMIVQKQLGYNDKAIVILNTNGFYNKLIEFFDEIIKQKFAREDSGQLYFIADNPQEAVDYLKNYSVDERLLSKEDIYTRG